MFSAYVFFFLVFSNPRDLSLKKLDIISHLVCFGDKKMLKNRKTFPSMNFYSESSLNSWYNVRKIGIL